MTDKIEKYKDNVLKITKTVDKEEFVRREDIEREIAECEETIERNKRWLKQLE